MRTLFSCNNISSHLDPLLPLIRAAEGAGHTVAVAAPPELSERITRYGLEHVLAGSEWITPRVTAEAKQLESITLQKMLEAQPSFLDYMADKPAVDCAQGILDAKWDPDVIVRECMEFGGALAAEKLGVPSATIGNGCFVPKAFHPIRMAKIFRASREAMGLPEDPGGESAYRHLYASLMPRQFDRRIGHIPNVRYYQDNSLTADKGQLPEELANLPADRPLIYGCLSSSSLAYGGLVKYAVQMMEVMVSALSQLDCTAVVSTGKWVEPGHFGKLPGHVRVLDHVPQKLLLGRTDLFITHAGFASVRESVHGGTPMVTLPLIGDSPYIARCAAERGIAKNIPFDKLTVEALGRTCVAVLADPKYGRSVRHLRRQMLALPGLEALVADLESLAKLRR